MFRDRKEAGRRLAAALEGYASEAPVVLGLLRGGVPVAHEVARALGAPLDVVVVRKVGAPGQEERSLGALAEGGFTVLHQDLAGDLGVREEALQRQVERRRAEMEARVRLLRGDFEPIDIEGRTVIVVDDCIATGGTVAAALRSVRERGGRRVILAVPVASRDALEELSGLVDDVVCLRAPAWLGTIGAWYEDSSPTSDREVVDLLEEARGGTGKRTPRMEPGLPLAERELTINAEGVPLPAHLSVPPAPRALVLFAHESGGQLRPRELQMAAVLHRHNLATLLFDPLTAREEREEDEGGYLRFEVSFLARRLAAATDWARRFGPLPGIPLAYLGQGACAAAALVAVAERPGAVSSVVCCGGRPDLSHRWLLKVMAPVLILAGGADDDALRRNRAVLSLLPSGSRMGVLPGSTQLFDRPGGAEMAGEAAANWFVQHLEPDQAERGEAPVQLP